jgi:molybdopterin-guanine dinucleotide biosynthesis protein B/molybdopterin-guanine dinucleotide biosynthesis protein
MSPLRKASPAPVAVGVLLAGGRGRRMGFDKRTLEVGGETLVERGVAALRQVFPTVTVSLRTEADSGLVPSGCDVICDEIPGSPLAGIASALAHYDAPVFVLAGDMPFAERAAIREVVEAFDNVDVALPVAQGQIEPLHAVYGRGCLAPINELLAAGNHKIPDLYPRVRVAEVPFATSALFFSVNTPADLEDARRRLDRERHDAAHGRPALAAVVGKSGSGKTTLLEKLIPELCALGLRVGAVKHDAHGFDIDVPGKDSWRLGQAGVEAYVVHSPVKLALVSSLAQEASLVDIVLRYFTGFDIVVVEGHKLQCPSKIEVFRQGAGHDQPLCDPGEAVATVTDTGISRDPSFGLDDVATLARFLTDRLPQFRKY